jgi:predicted N-acyltransferase
VSAIENEARAAGLALLVPWLLPEDSALAECLKGRGYHMTLQHPVAMMDLPFRRFSEYVESLRRVSRSMPSMVRTEMKRPARDGITVEEIADAWPHAARLHALAAQHQRRLNGVELPYSAALIPSIKERLGDACLLYGAFGAGELLGFSLYLRDPTSMHGIFYGIDERARKSCVYFLLCYYRPIADAIADGIGRAYFGTLLQEVKRRRGCRIVPSRFAYRGSTPLRHAAVAPWFALHRARGARRFGIPEEPRGEA